MNASDNLQTALVHHKAGRTDEAARIYEKIITESPEDPPALRLLGIIKASQQQYGEAEQLIQRALDAAPGFAAGHSSMGLVLLESGHPDAAVQSCRKALELNPGLIEAQLALAMAQMRTGDTQSAKDGLIKIIDSHPNHAIAYFHLGTLFKQSGDIGNAIKCYRKTCELKPKERFPFVELVGTIANVQFTQLDPALANIILACFSVPDLNYRDLAVPTASLLKLDPLTSSLFVTGSREAAPNWLSTDNLNRLSSSLLIQFLTKCICPDRQLELTLAELRRQLLSYALSEDNSLYENPDFRSLAYALSNQCFFNEYLYSLTEKEVAALSKLQDRLANTSGNINAEICTKLAILGCYIPLIDSGVKPDLLKPLPEEKDPAFNTLLDTQYAEPALERSLRNRIPSLIADRDSITEAVQNQYEENPFPRWNTSSKRVPGGMASEIRTLFPHARIADNINCESPEILIAGCGTGLQAINCSRTYENARITAVDLSLSSLSYAVRKTRELGITNIDFFHANILELDRLDRKFDLVECFGVLHHLSDQDRGWDILSGLMKDNGFMMLGLYSEIARESVVACRDLIARNNYPPTMEGIRQCREDIFEIRNNPVLEQITSPRAAFWTTSELRDLIFHEMEHRYTLPEISRYIEKLDLQFLGFQHHSPTTAASYRTAYPNDNPATRLDNWHLFETENPQIFSNCYKFWLTR